MRLQEGNFVQVFLQVVECIFETAELLPAATELTGNKRNIVVATYDIDAESHEDFFNAYVMALKTAFTDLVVDNEKLISVIDDIYSESIDEVYGVSTGSR